MLSVSLGMLKFSRHLAMWLHEYSINESQFYDRKELSFLG